jgi:(p)ppGpp synthase/HD superfamily hydrolase
MSDLVQRAKELAYRAHAGQVDKAGRPYIEHVARVAAAVSNDPEAEAVAWLHDVPEDCPRHIHEVEWFPSKVKIGVILLMRVAHGAVADRRYYEAIKGNPLAIRVKLADIADNSDEARLALLDPKTADRLRRKYRRALEMLGQQQTTPPLGG